jgi:transposase
MTVIDEDVFEKRGVNQPQTCWEITRLNLSVAGFQRIGLQFNLCATVVSTRGGRMAIQSHRQHLREFAAPTDRAKRGSKRHLICDGRGVPLAGRLTGANRNNSQEALALVDAIPPLHGERGRPRRRPDCVLGDRGDRGYDAAAIRRGLRARHTEPLVAMRRKHGSGLGRWRWVVERTFTWLNQFRRLRVRYDKRADIHEAFLSIGCALICWQSLRKTWSTAWSRCHPSRRWFAKYAVLLWKIASTRLLGSLPEGQALDIGLHYAVFEDLSRSTDASPI